MSLNWLNFSRFSSSFSSTINYHSSSYISSTNNSGYVSFTSKGMEGDLFDWLWRPKIISKTTLFNSRIIHFNIENV
jgi:hypothetical protein